jgi:microsomal epoxide hydrolase
MRQPLPGEPFRVAVPDEILTDLHQRLAQTRWPIEPAGGGWRYGANLDYVRGLVAHWQTGFDWRAWEARINRFEQRRIEVDGLKIHILIEPGSGSNPLPLMLTHGWPGSFLEFIDLIEPLAHPERFGGSAKDGFTVIVPSLPGYGFSDPPPAPITPRQVAALWHKLAVDKLGLSRYVAQGGDWGSAVTSWLALDHPQGLAAIHLNMTGLRPWTGEGAPPVTDEEKAWIVRIQKHLVRETAYQQIQGTKPQTLAYALTDSPAGLAAWIVEKFHGWTIGGEDRDPPFDMDWLIANVMLYWLNGINAANWLYVSIVEGTAGTLKAGERVGVPTGLSLFPRDLLLPPPKSWVERAYDVRYYRVFERGGHFPAVEQGPLLADEIRRFFRDYR